MAKRSGKSKAQARRKSKRAKKGRTSSIKTRAPGPEEDHVDGCDLQFLDSQATPDTALPPAKGGVELIRGKDKSASDQAT
jgi:hypothetical protein